MFSWVKKKINGKIQVFSLLTHRKVFSSKIEKNLREINSWNKLLKILLKFTFKFPICWLFLFFLCYWLVDFFFFLVFFFFLCYWRDGFFFFFSSFLLPERSFFSFLLFIFFFDVFWMCSFLSFFFFLCSYVYFHFNFGWFFFENILLCFFLYFN